MARLRGIQRHLSTRASYFLSGLEVDLLTRKRCYGNRNHAQIGYLKAIVTLATFIGVLSLVVCVTKILISSLQMERGVMMSQFSRKRQLVSLRTSLPTMIILWVLSLSLVVFRKYRMTLCNLWTRFLHQMKFIVLYWTRRH
ncbi:hypothetical protein V6N13_064692 [Hibiscus sabdariffa]